MYVSVVLTDGLGNRFFQVAAMLWYAERTGRTPLLIRDWIAAERHPAAQPITAYFPHIPVAQSAPAGRWRTLRSPDAFAAPTDELLEAMEARTFVKLEGWFQHVDFLPHTGFSDALRLLRTASLPSIDYENSAFLHIRRGDYLHPACAHHRVDLRNYYGLALSLFADETATKIVVVSDDIEWAKTTFPSEYSFISASRWVFCEGLNDFQTLSAMMRCGRGGITANSTFSWWGAFFGHFGCEEGRMYTMPGTWGLPPLPAEVGLYPAWATVLPV